ncbi:MAG: hypothetical protein MUP19_00255 [Candidatus Aminicenantes bacterium]|nr:hypothetical protein [Candidatus Aminicenantes bacterium]
MRKTFILGLAVCLVVGIAACKKGGESGSYAALGKYAEVGPVIDKFIGVNEDFIAALEKAVSADGVAAAMNAVTEQMAELAPKMKAIGEKFPEFKSMDNPPAELKPYNTRLEAVMGKMMGAIGKIAPFMSDPKVIEAQEKYNKVMGDMK